MNIPGTVGGTDDRFICAVCGNDNAFVMGQPLSRRVEGVYERGVSADMSVAQCIICKTSYMWTGEWEFHYSNRECKPCG